MRILTIWIFPAVAVVVSAASAGADEAKAPINAMAVLNLLSQPIEPRAAAFDKSLRDPGPAPATSGTAGEIIDEGTVRYGRATVTVKNPCPPGTAHYEPPALPGRRR